MPHYSYEKTFSAEGSKQEQEELEMLCAWGILTDVVIAFRFGTDRTTHVHIDDGLHQVFPTNPEETYAYDGYTLEIRDEYQLARDSRKIYLRGWNTGTYSHTIAVAFRIKPFEYVSPIEASINRLTDIILSVLYGKKKR